MKEDCSEGYQWCTNLHRRRPRGDKYCTVLLEIVA